MSEEGLVFAGFSSFGIGLLEGCQMPVLFQQGAFQRKARIIGVWVEDGMAADDDQSVYVLVLPRRDHVVRVDEGSTFRLEPIAILRCNTCYDCT